METRKDGVSNGVEYKRLMDVSYLATDNGSSQQPHNNALSQALALVLSHGWNSTSFQIINPGIKRWFSADSDAVVGFVTYADVRVVAGAPVCDEERLTDVAAEFETDAEATGERVCYFGAEARLESIYKDSPVHTQFLLGAQPVWRPELWAEKIASHSSLRAQLNRARNKGVTVSEWPVEKACDHPDLQRVLYDWLGSKGLPPLHFMVEPDTLSRLTNRRVFVAECGGCVTGFVVLSPVAKRGGWLFEQFPHSPGSPNGTVELMIDRAMRALADDGCEYATLGLSPLSKRANLDPYKSPLWLRILLGWLRKHGQRFYNFDGLDAFKAKLRPDRWDPVFAVSNETQVSFRTLYAIAGAFSGNAVARMIIGGLARAVAKEFYWLRQKAGFRS